MLSIERIIINDRLFKLQIDDYVATENKENCNKANSNLITGKKSILDGT